MSVSKIPSPLVRRMRSVRPSSAGSRRSEAGRTCAPISWCVKNTIPFYHSCLRDGKIVYELFEINSPRSALVRRRKNVPQGERMDKAVGIFILLRERIELRVKSRAGDSSCREALHIAVFPSCPLRLQKNRLGRRNARPSPSDNCFSGEIEMRRPDREQERA